MDGESATGSRGFKAFSCNTHAQQDAIPSLAWSGHTHVTAGTGIKHTQPFGGAGCHVNEDTISAPGYTLEFLVLIK
jgi:hypothetical protein